jgi:hypothetical protein
VKEFYCCRSTQIDICKFYNIHSRFQSDTFGPFAPAWSFSSEGLKLWSTAILIV